MKNGIQLIPEGLLLLNLVVLFIYLFFWTTRVCWKVSNFYGLSL